MTTRKVTLKDDNPKEAPAKTKKLPKWPGVEAAEIGVQYENARGNIIQRGATK